MKKLISYILPVFNEVEGIERFYNELRTQLSSIENKYFFELIFIDDGSTDGSLDKLVQLSKKDSSITVITFSRNFGHQYAITAGLDYVKGDCAIIIDTDMQDPPSVSLELIKKWEEGYEVVYAQRKSRKDGLVKRVTAYLFYRVLNKLSNIKMPPDTGDYRLLDRKAILTVNRFREKNRYMRGIVSYVGFDQVAVMFDRDKRFAGKTKYSLKKMMTLAVDGVINFSSGPSRLIIATGLIINIVSLVTFLFLLISKYLYLSEINNSLVIISSMSFLISIQILILGIISEYISRVYGVLQNRPLYIVSSIIIEGKDKTDQLHKV